MGAAGGPNIVTDSLEFCYDAANPKSYPGSGNNISDLANNYSDMALYGNTSYGGFHRDGTKDGAVTLTASGIADTNGCILRNSTDNISTHTNSSFSTMGWMYRTSSNSAELMSYREVWTRLSLEITDTGIFFNQRNTSSPYATNTTSKSVTNSRNVWDFFALTSDGTKWTFYKNSSNLGTNTFSMGETTPSATKFHIGAAWSDDDYLGRGMNGMVGHVLHYTKTLTSGEVFQNYNATKTRYDNFELEA